MLFRVMLNLQAILTVLGAYSSIQQHIDHGIAHVQCLVNLIVMEQTGIEWSACRRKQDCNAYFASVMLLILRIVHAASRAYSSTDHAIASVNILHRLLAADAIIARFGLEVNVSSSMTGRRMRLKTTSVLQ